jgi:hypothetical protein
MKLARDLRVAFLALAGMAIAFTACGGTASAGSGLQVDPASTQALPGGTVAFRARAQAGAALSVQWEVTEAGGGSIDATGYYTAPQGGATATYHVVARAASDSTVYGTAVVTVSATAQPVVTVSVNPPTATVAAGGTASFSAQVGGTSNGAVTWSVQEAGGGTVSSSGTYTAPATPGTYHVVATSQADGTKTASATITVTSSGGSVTGLAAQMAVLAQKAIFFEHASVGTNVEWGIDDLLGQVSGPKPTLRRAENGTQGAATIAAALGPGKIYGNWFPSLNEYPFRKIDAFEALINGGVGAKADIAMMKFCFTDLPTGDASATASSIFAAYKAMMDRLRAAYPNVRFVHWTMPLSQDGASMNGPKEQFNALVRSTYGGREPVLDVALLESTRPDGSHELVGGVPSLYPGYASDSGHLNATGYDMVAQALVALLANL